MRTIIFFFFAGGLVGAGLTLTLLCVCVSLAVSPMCAVCIVVGALARISLLTDFEDATSYRDWTVGTHGIQITFTPPPTSPPASDAPSPLSSAVSLLSRPLASFSSSSSSSHGVPTATTIRRALSATYLPEVAPDQGWGHIDAIDSAIRKAGWNDRISEDLRRAVRVRRYRSRKCVVGWDEFVAWRAERGFPVSVDLLDDHERGFNHLGHGQEEEEEDDEEDEDKDGF